jgi:hypothetical protein
MSILGLISETLNAVDTSLKFTKGESLILLASDY